jgi:uncharacterized protein YgiM (DUF1202 family)
MIEQSSLPRPPSDLGDLDVLQQRANRHRQRHSRTSRTLTDKWQQVCTTLGSPTRSMTRLPARFLLHLIVALVLPMAVLLSQFDLSQPVVVSQSASPSSDSDIVAPLAPLDLNAAGMVGDAPLDENGDIPVPLSLVSRSEALAPVVIDAMIAGERINLRNGPGTAYDEVGHMSADLPVQVIGRDHDGNWFQVRGGSNKPIYWVAAELLSMPDGGADQLLEVSPDQIAPPPPPKIATVAEDGLSLRDGPGTNYISMAKLQAGAQLDLLERYQEWFHVGIPGGADGWVKGDFLAIAAGINERLLAAETVPDPNPALVGMIAENLVNLRKGPDSKYAKVGGINGGTRVDLIGKYKDWFQVKLDNGAKAWVFSDLLSVTERVVRRLPVSKDFPALPVAARGRTSGASANLANIPASGDVASYAMNFVGSRYVYGGASPSRGFDCSGLTSYVYNKYGVNLPHNAAAQFNTAYGASVGSMDNLKPGDLVFFVGTAGAKRGISHTGIYVGGGRMVNAMTPRYGVQVSNIYASYWVKHYYGGIRPNR